MSRKRAARQGTDPATVTRDEFLAALLPAESIGRVAPALGEVCAVVSTPWTPPGEALPKWPPRAYVPGRAFNPELYVNWATCKAVEYRPQKGKRAGGIYIEPRATNEAFHAQHFLMLDDIGNTAKSCLTLDDPRVAAATYLMETSADNHQVGYKLAEPLGKEDNARLRAALIAAKLGDPGALQNPHRWARVPGSVNMKPDRNGWRSVLRAWHPERAYTLQALAELLGLDLHAVQVPLNGSYGPVELPEDIEQYQDLHFSWMRTLPPKDAQGKPNPGAIIGDRSGNGFFTIVCPWWDEHSVTPDASYRPGFSDYAPAFKCFHGHGKDTTTGEGTYGTREFLDWCIAQQRGEKQKGDEDALTAQLIERARPAGLDLLGVQLPDKAHVVDGLLPVDVSIVGAGSGQRKTMLLLHEAVRIVCGLDFYGHRVLTPGAVLYIHAEDDTEEMRRRVQRVANSFDSEAHRRRIVEGIVLLNVADLMVSLIGHDRETGQFYRAPLADALVKVVELVRPVWVVIDPTANVQRYEDRALNDSWAVLIQTVRQNVTATRVAHTLVHHLSQEAVLNKSIHETALRGGTQFSNGSRFTRIIHTLREAECFDPQAAGDADKSKKIFLPERIGMEAVREGRVLRIHTAKYTYGPCNPEAPQFAVFEYGPGNSVQRPFVAAVLHGALLSAEVFERMKDRAEQAREAALVAAKQREEGYLKATRQLIETRGAAGLIKRDAIRNSAVREQLQALAKTHRVYDAKMPTERQMGHWLDSWLASGHLKGVDVGNKRTRLEVP